MRTGPERPSASLDGRSQDVLFVVDFPLVDRDVAGGLTYMHQPFVAPLDEDTLAESARKTGRVVVLDTASRNCGVSAEIVTRISERAFGFLKAPVSRITLPDAPTPCSHILESVFYPDADRIARTTEELVLA